MAFATGYLADPSQVGGGERKGVANTIITKTTFEDGLRVGRFAKLDTGSIDNMDGSVTPAIVGVPLRNVAAAVEEGLTVDASLHDNIELQIGGLVTVYVKTGESEPAFRGTVYASNAGDANDGLATSTGTDIEVPNCEFIEAVASNVWLVRLI